MYTKNGEVILNIPCPICEGEAVHSVEVNFNKSCEDSKGKVFGFSEKEMDYYRCRSCNFCFIPEMCDWPQEKFSKLVYNSDYTKADPEYISVRPTGLAKSLQDSYSHIVKSIKHLDFGGGHGLTSKILQAGGWDSTSYDPFVDTEVKPKELGKFNLITAFEVFEHVADVKGLLETLSTLLTKDGTIIFTTLLTDPHLSTNTDVGNWWYAAPRNGHISLYSVNSLSVLAQKYAFKLQHFSTWVHVFTQGNSIFLTE